MLEYAVATYDSVSAESAIEFCVGHLSKALHKGISVAKFSPKPGIRRKHAIEWINPAAAVLIHNIERYANRLLFALHDNAIAELCMIGDLQFRIVDENTVIVDDVVRKISTIRNGTVISDVAGYDQRIVNSGCGREIMMLQSSGFKAGYAYKSEE